MLHGELDHLIHDFGELSFHCWCIRSVKLNHVLLLLMWRDCDLVWNKVDFFFQYSSRGQLIALLNSIGCAWFWQSVVHSFNLQSIRSTAIANVYLYILSLKLSSIQFLVASFHWFNKLIKPFNILVGNITVSSEVWLWWEIFQIWFGGKISFWFFWLGFEWYEFLLVVVNLLE